MAVKSSAAILNGQFRNDLICGNFDIWQRGTSLSSSGFLADRWNNTSSSSTFTTSQQSFTLGQTSVPGNPTYFHRTVVTSANSTGNYFFLSQYIEDVRLYSGTTRTLSFWMKCDSPKTVAIALKQNFGSGGSASVFTPIILFSIGTNWQKYTAQFEIPSISGKVLGTDHNLELQIYYDAGTNYPTLCGNQSGTFDLARIQLEKGYVASTFEDRPRTVELNLCYRYCWVSTSDMYIHDSWYSSTGLAYSIAVPVEMRRIPTLFNTTEITYWRVYVGASGQSGFTISNNDKAANIITVIATKSAHGLGNSTNLQIRNGFGLSAEF